jgi:hypothetical protein
VNENLHDSLAWQTAFHDSILYCCCVSRSGENAMATSLLLSNQPEQPYNTNIEKSKDYISEDLDVPIPPQYSRWRSANRESTKISFHQHNIYIYCDSIVHGEILRAEDKEKT